MGEQLCLVHRQDALDSFQLEDQCILYKHIDAISAVQQHLLVAHGNRHLPPKRHAAVSEFVTETLVVRRFQKTRPEFLVHFYSRADHDLGEFLKDQLPPCLGASVVLHHVCSTPTLNSFTSGFSAAASSAMVIASRVSTGSM